MSYDDVLTYAIIMVALEAINGVGHNHFYTMGYLNGTKVRVAVCNLIYKKSLRLSQAALCETSPGKLANLLSNDVNRFDYFVTLMSSLWGAPLVTVISAVLLWHEAGWTGMIGLVIIAIVVPTMSE